MDKGSSQMLTGKASGPRAKVLVIDDESPILHLLREELKAKAFQVRGAVTGEEGIELITTWHPDVIVLDLALPDGDGRDFCRGIHSDWPEIPVIVLSGRDKPEDIVTALQAGAYDYVTKPFFADVLIERIRVGLRSAAHHSGSGPGTVLRTGGLTIDFERRRVTVDGVEVSLTPKEYGVLGFLARHVQRVVTHDMLLRNVWGAGYEDAINALRVFINKLRKKIEIDPSRPRYVLTRHLVGYELALLPVAPDTTTDERGARPAPGSNT